MKKQISFVLIGLMIVSGLILALPFSSLRKSLQVIDFQNYLLVGVDSKINADAHMVVAQSIAVNLFRVDSSGDMGVNNSGQLGMNKSFNVVSSLHESPNRNQTQQALDGSYVADRTPLLLNQSLSAGQSVVNSTDINRTSYKTNMTSRTSVNNSKSRLMAMSGSFNSETATAAQGSVRQMAGGAPPPSEDEVIPPIGTLPIGDGYCFMFILAVLFGVFKARKLIFA